MNLYRILWDNGHDSGVLDYGFTNKRKAVTAAREWKREMVALEPAKTRSGARHAYQWEVIVDDDVA